MKTPMQNGKVTAFAALVQREQSEEYARHYGTERQELLDAACHVTIRPGKKWTKIDVGPGGKFMVLDATGEILGIKACGVPHSGHRYGTLDTTADWFWGDYHPQRKAVVV